MVALVTPEAKTNGTLFTDPATGHTTVTWKVGENIVIVAYPKGRGFPADKSGINEERQTISKRVSDAYKAIEAGESGLWAKKKLTHSPGILTFYCVTPEMSKVVTTFPRFPQRDDDLSTPFNSVIWKSLLTGFLNIPITSLTLGLEGSKIIDQAIRGYLSKNTNPKVWGQFAKDNFFETWSSNPEWILGYRSFSSVAWGITSTLVLGDSSVEKKDFSSLWNNLFAPDITQEARKEVLLSEYHGGLVPYLVSLIRQYRENPSAFPNTFQAYWTESNIHEKLCATLTPDEIELANQYAAQFKMSLEDYLLFSSIVTISIGMQENFAFTVTETLKQICNNPDLLKQCQANLKICYEAVQETLRYIAPSGEQKQARWDLTIIDNNVIRRYEIDAGDGIATHPIYLGRSPILFTNPNEFDVSRKGKAKACPFSSGPQRCPGETTALAWMTETVHRVITEYRVSVENPENVDYETHFTLKSDPEIKILIEKK